MELTQTTIVAKPLPFADFVLPESKQGQNFLNLSFPTTRNEYWKYTRLGKLKTAKLKISQTSNITVETINNIVAIDRYQLVVFENGFLRNDLSDLTGIEENNTLSKKLSNEYFTALSDASFTSGINLKVKANTVLTKPLLLVNSSSDPESISNINHNITTQQGSEAMVCMLDLAAAEGSGFLNSVTRINAESSSNLEIVNLQVLGKATAIQNIYVDVAEDASFKHFGFSLIGQLTRNNINVNLNKTGAYAELNGVYVPSGSHHIDNHTYIDHIAPNCNSSELYRGILSNTATGVFNGKVMVRQAAQKTNAFQANNNILLSDKATMNSKPELEIYADDVKCSHGSTTGQMDKDALFYLQARGIKKTEAVKLLVTAFADDVVSRLSNEHLAELINAMIEKQISEN